MADPQDLIPFVLQRLNAAPFSKMLTLLQLGDEHQGLPTFALFQLVHEAMVQLDGQQPSALAQIDIRNEDPVSTVERVMAFMRTVQFRPPSGRPLDWCARHHRIAIHTQGAFEAAANGRRPDLSVTAALLYAKE